MVESSFQHIISGWGLMQGWSSEQPPDLDDTEDFKLSKSENSDRFGQPISDEVIDEAIAKRIPYKAWKITEWVLSIFRSWSSARRGTKDMAELVIDELADLLPHFVMEATI